MVVAVTVAGHGDFYGHFRLAAAWKLPWRLEAGDLAAAAAATTGEGISYGSHV